MSDEQGEQELKAGHPPAGKTCKLFIVHLTLIFDSFQS